ncbi:Bro-N domain-containing protein [Campylobacter upsaliensis]|uniref:BRO-N domain-containing protein n=1 Tax=Campylobacter upsaliensis TaxID=28080 RepID=UPI0022EAFE67|nr:BRO family protein [Campylobacter upsaliensis]
MHKTLIFKRENQEIRVAKDEFNEPLFCLSDVCRSLELTTPAKIVEMIKGEFELYELNSHSFDTGYGIKEFTMITEPQLYFMLMRSDKPKAREFRQWVINEVLPSIRKSGSYNSTNQNLQEENLRLKDELINMQNEMIQTQKALIDELKNKQEGVASNMIDLVKINTKIKRVRAKKTKNLSKTEKMHDDLKFMIKVLSSIPQANITQKMIWSYLYKVIIKEFNYKRQLSIQIIKENKEFLTLIHNEANNLIKKAQDLSIQEQKTLESANYHKLFEIS